MSKKEILVSKDLLMDVISGNKDAIEQVKSIISNEYIISKKVVDEAYYTYNRENAKKIFDVFGISSMSFVNYLYDLYEKDSNIFFISSYTYREEVISKIVKRFEYIKDFETSEEVMTNLNFNTDRVYAKVIEKYIIDDYYRRDVIDVVLRILKEAEILGIENDKVDDFINLKPFTEDSYYVFKHLSRFKDRVIKLYFNKDKLFSNIFEIASYLAKTKAPSIDLENFSVEYLNIGDNPNKVLENNGIRTIKELQDVLDKDKIISLDGIDVESAKIIIDALGKFYLEFN